MGYIEKQFIRLMKHHFGALGPLFLLREMRKLQYYDIDALEDDEKLKLIDALMKHAFNKIYSPNRRMVIKMKLISIAQLSPETQERLNKEMKEAFEHI